jgi:hypothetical protein
MESTTTSTTKDVRGSFVPIPELDKMAVGHAGLYPVDAEEVDVEATPEHIEPLGTAGAGKVLLNIEENIKLFVKDQLKTHKFPGSEHLPKSETGIWVYYLTKGIKEELNVSWEKQPLSIIGRSSSTKNDREKGVIKLNKKAKNELLAQLSYEYYEDDVNNGIITQADAFAMMAKKAADKKYYEDQGFYISKNKTEGVKLFDWKSEIIEMHSGLDSATKVYTTNKIEVLVPNLTENYYKKNPKAKRVMKEMGKSALYFTEGVGDLLTKGTAAEPEVTKVGSNADIMNYLAEKYPSQTKKITDEYDIKGIHLTKIMQSGMMKPRQVCIDCISKQDKKQVLFLLGQDGSVSTFKAK